jgi:hypothetical protein
MISRARDAPIPCQLPPATLPSQGALVSTQLPPTAPRVASHSAAESSPGCISLEPVQMPLEV